jgi:protein tyrosine phosphatase (PTP) superfamily phosphohydrolase (DUF442 family)
MKSIILVAAPVAEFARIQSPWRLSEILRLHLLAPIVAVAIAVGISAQTTVHTSAVASPKKIESAVLPNTYRLTDKVLSGGQPQGEPAFKQLQELGVRTIISVDGATPNVALAKKYGLRYVHLPHGYDGIAKERLVELAKAVRELPGAVYIHCHHGKHRSPAAAAAACVSAGYLNNDQALSVLTAAGTSRGYRGLFQTVERARPIDIAILKATHVEFPETADIPPLADAMIAIEHTHDHLKVIAASQWQPTEEHADIDPPHEALLLREHYTELLRTDEVKRQPAEFQRLLQQSETNAKDLEDRLRTGRRDPRELNALFERITADCTACHQKFRDIPLDEKNANERQ